MRQDQEQRLEDNLEERIAQDIIPIKEQDRDFILPDVEGELLWRDYASSLFGIVTKNTVSTAVDAAKKVGKGLLYVTAGGLPYRYQMALQQRLGKDNFDAENATEVNVYASLGLYTAVGPFITYKLGGDVVDIALSGVLSFIGGVLLTFGRSCVAEENERKSDDDKAFVAGEPITSLLSLPVGLGIWAYNGVRGKAHNLHEQAKEKAVDKRYGRKI